MKLVVVAVYRPPKGCIYTFLDTLHEMIMYIMQNFNGAKVILAGDFNIDFLTACTEKVATCNELLTFNLSPTFHEPSRVRGNSATCIDQVFVEDGADCEVETVQPHFSDHLGQKLSISTTTSPPKKAKHVRIRKITAYNVQAFNTKLGTINWEEMNNDPIRQFSRFYECFLSCFNESFPLVSVEMRPKCGPSINWMTDNLRTLKTNLDALDIVNRVQKTAESQTLYNQIRREYGDKIREAKANAVRNHIRDAQNKNKATWDIIKLETGKRGTGYRYGDGVLSSDDFNTFFASVGEEMSINIPGPTLEATALVARAMDSVIGSMFLAPTDESEVKAIINGIKSKSVTDIDGITTCILKQISHNIVAPLTVAINNMFINGIFPEKLRRAKILPVFKSGQKDSLNNFRPISILPAISKVFEEAIKRRLLGYFENKRLFSNSQYGYRSGRSTVAAIRELVDSVAEAFDRRDELGLLCCDLSKAFDCVDHSVLLDKLKLYGVRGTPLQVIESYLSDRKQWVHWDGEISGVRVPNRGVPQGSVLGPLLFIIYMNDLPDNINCVGALMYADDASFLVRSLDEKESVLGEAVEWIGANKLKINTKKTQELMFSTRNSGGSSLRLLGLYLDPVLAWSVHVANLQPELAKSIYAIRRIRRIAGQDAARLAYFGAFHSRATYGILLWGGSSHVKEIFLQQKKAIRAVVGVNSRTSCRQIFKSLEILTIMSCYILSCLIQFHMTDKPPTHSDIHNYDTRNKDKIVTPFHRIGRAQTSTNYISIKLYNHLPDRVKNLETSKFKRTLIRLLRENVIYTMEEFYSLNLARML